MNYIRPDISFRRLDTASGVASACELLSTHEPYTCPVNLGEDGWTLFSDYGLCFVTPADTEEQVCYHVPIESMNVFES